MGRNGISVDPSKVEKIKEFSELTSVRDTWAALGFFSYYWRFVKDFSKIAKPMTMLLKKDTPFK